MRACAGDVSVPTDADNARRLAGCGVRAGLICDWSKCDTEKDACDSSSSLPCRIATISSWPFCVTKMVCVGMRTKGDCESLGMRKEEERRTHADVHLGQIFGRAQREYQKWKMMK